MANGRILRIMSIAALALLALLLTTPVFAATLEEHPNADSASQFCQQVRISEKPESVDQLFAAEYVIHKSAILSCEYKK